jgi:hypothetical protein
VENSEDAQSASGVGADAPAMVLGLTGASRATADAFPELQMEKMRERNELSHFRAGKPAEAKAQPDRAAQLDLTASGKSELTQQHLGEAI